MDPGDSFLNDLDRLRLPEGQTASAGRTCRIRPPRHRAGERFLKGPIPWPWLCRAARLPGRALHVALAVWYLAGVHRSASVHLSLSCLARELGVLRDSARRGLEELEQAGLVQVARHASRRSEVTLLTGGPA